MLLRREGTFYSRLEHGNYKVLADSSGFKVHWPTGVRAYPSARQTIIAIINGVESPTPECRDPKIAFDRYFKTKVNRVKTRSSFDIATIISDASLSIQKPAKVEVISSPCISIEDNTKLGIDLSVYHLDVRRLFYAGFSKRAKSMGYDPEDVLQEVYKGILVRNNGKCPHDPRKSSLGHYVHMVSSCILSNFNRKHSRIRNNEWLGTLNEEGEEVDFALSKDLVSLPDQFSSAFVGSFAEGLSQTLDNDPRLRNFDNDSVRFVIDLMASGYKKSEIIEKTGISQSSLSKIMRVIRATSRYLYDR